MNKYNKQQRIKLIKEILESQEVKSQEDLVSILLNMRINVTQPTIAKDLKELGVIKVNKGNKSYYALPDEEQENILLKIKFAFKNFVKDIVNEENLILVKTTPGNANSVGAFIDKYGIKGVVGTVAGDDTILVVSKKKKTEEVIKQFKFFKES
jgi:transcriptional regulator of arginine metabolism